MAGYRWGSGRRIAGIGGLALFVAGLTACAPVVGGGVLAAVVTAGALTAQCYDYLDVSVYDAQGRKTCAATVSARSGRDVEELTSCYYTPLSDGRWTVSAALPGYTDAVTTVQVEHEKDCIRHVQTLELTLNLPGYVSGTRQHGVTRPLPEPKTAPAPVPPAEAGSTAPPPEAPPTGVFPDQTPAAP